MRILRARTTQSRCIAYRDPMSCPIFPVSFESCRAQNRLRKFSRQINYIVATLTGPGGDLAVPSHWTNTYPKPAGCGPDTCWSPPPKHGGIPSRLTPLLPEWPAGANDCTGPNWPKPWSALGAVRGVIGAASLSVDYCGLFTSARV